jgi:hypothetical protein
MTYTYFLPCRLVERVQAERTNRSYCGQCCPIDLIGFLPAYHGNRQFSLALIGLTNLKESAAVPPNPTQRTKVQGPGNRSVYANELLERPSADRVSSIHHVVFQAL